MLPAEPCRLLPKFIGDNTMATLQEQIYSINERLRSFGIEAIQEIKMTDREGKTHWSDEVRLSAAVRL